MNELRSDLTKIENIIKEVDNVSYYLDDTEEEQLYKLLNKIKEEIQDFLSIEELATINQQAILSYKKGI